MLDRISLDQLRTFATVANDGSFSAAARRMARAQSAVSEAIRNLEAQLGIVLFDRSGRYPQLTPAGASILADARQVLSSVDGLAARAKGMAAGIEPELAVVVDIFFPLAVLASAAEAFQARFPATPLRLSVEVLGAAIEPVVDGRVSFGITSLASTQVGGLASEHLTGARLKMVASANHPLARWQGKIPQRELARHVQLVLTDRSKLTADREFGVMAPFTWRLADLFAKHAFLLNGLGWGGMPSHSIKDDLKVGRLVQLQIEGVPEEGLDLALWAIYPASAPPGPAGRWMIERLKVEQKAAA